MLRGILKILVIMGLVYGATYLIPKDAREKALSRLGNLISAITPASVKEKMEPVIFSPMERRQKLLDQLEKNIETIKSGISKTAAPGNATAADPANPDTQKNEEPPAPEELVRTLEETQKIIEEIEEINDEQGVVNKVTTKIYKSVTGGGSEAAETCSCEQKP